MQNFAGRHLVLDVQTTGSDSINSMEGVYAFFESITALLDMTLLFPPIVIRYPWASSELERVANSLNKAGNQQGAGLITELLDRRREEECGISGTAIWAESHCSFHSWTEKNFVSIDLYSCKDFDAVEATKHITQCFEVNTIQGLSITRSRLVPQVIQRIFCTGSGQVTIS